MTREGQMDLLIVAIASLVLLVPALLVINALIDRWLESDVSHGFEVKRTTGPTPVLLKERENDHG